MQCKKHNFHRLAAFAFLATAGITTASAQAVTAPTQTLDRVITYTPSTALNMAFNDPDRPQDFTNLLLPGTNRSTCTLTPTGGLYCLDGQIVRNWPKPTEPTSVTDLFNCGDAWIGLDNRKGDACSSMTVNKSGVIWLAGKKNNAHNVVRVVAKLPAASCPAGNYTSNPAGTYCAKLFYSGRPVLVDLAPIDADVAANFRPVPNSAPQGGVLGIEEKKNAVFFPDPLAPQPITVVSSRDWGLSGNEQLQDVALLQVSDGGSGKRNFILATTSTGRVLAKNTEVAGPATPVYNIPQARTAAAARPASSIPKPVPASQCTNLAQQYGMRASTTTGTLYISDRSYCQVLALKPVFNGAGTSLTALTRVAEGNEDLVLLTTDGSGSYPVLGLTIAPGISIDLRAACVLRCEVISGPDGTPAAEFIAIQIPSANSGATIFQVKGIPDCRYEVAALLAGKPFSAAQSTACAKAGVIVNPGNPPAGQLLNVTPLLPADATSSFDLTSSTPPNGLPPLLISQQYRAQLRNGYIFEALFVVTQPGVRFTNTFESEFDVSDLEGVLDGPELGCEPDADNLIAWDVGTIVSEKFPSVGNQHVDTLTNTGPCGSYRGGTGRLSLLPYNMEVAPDTYGLTVRVPVQVRETKGNDAVFARLIQKLHADLGWVLQNQACVQVDGGVGAPIPNCASLIQNWANADSKLKNCIDAAFQPKSSARNENCKAFVAQLNNFKSSLPATSGANDLANRLGEVKVRVNVIQNLYSTRFLPSIPDFGFCMELNGCTAAGTAPPPWAP